LGGAYEQAKVSCLVDEGVDDELGRTFFTQVEGDAGVKLKSMVSKGPANPRAKSDAEALTESPLK